MVKVLITGSAGFIGGYVVEDMLRRGYEVVGLDNYSKYGPVTHSYSSSASYQFVEGDARDVDLLADLLVIAAPHPEYHDLATDKPVADMWGVTGRGMRV